MDRSQSTPITQANSIVGGLSAMYAEWWMPHKKKHEFIDVIFKRLWEDETTDGDEGFRQLVVMAENRDMENLRYGLMYTAFISCAYCIQAIKASRTGQVSEAWSYIADAKFWQGIAAGMWARSSVHKEGPKGAAAWHENHAANAILSRLREGGKLGGLRSTETRRKTAVDKAAVLSAAEVMGWPITTQGVLKRLSLKFNCSPERIGQILKAPSPK
jgi:hypothetical protein